MSRCCFLLCLLVVSMMTYPILAENTVEEYKMKLQQIAETPFDETAEQYKAFSQNIGQSLIETADRMLGLPDLSPEDKRTALLMKYWGIVRKFGFDKETKENQQDLFAKSLENIPEGKELCFTLLMMAYSRNAPEFHKLDDPQEKEKFLPWREKNASFLVDYSPETADLAREMLTFADLFDKNASEGLVLSTMELLRPIFSKPDALEDFGLRFCMGMERRVLLPGKEMPFAAKALDGTTVDIKDFRGKVVLLQFGTTVPENEPMIPVYKKLVATLPEQDFVLLDYNISDFTGTAREKEKLDPLPWLTLYRLIGEGMQDYTGYYGTWSGVFLIDRAGKVVASRPEQKNHLWYELAKLLPNHEKQIAGIAAEHEMVVLQEKKKTQELLASLGVSQEDPDPNPIAAEMLELLTEMCSMNWLIGPDRQRTKTSMELLELIRALPGLSQFQAEDVRILRENLLKQTAIFNIEDHPETNPAVFFAEFEQLIDEQLAKKTGGDSNVITLVNEKIEILRHIQKYLQRTPDKLETARHIQERFVEILKIKPMTEHSTGAGNVRYFILWYLKDLNNVDPTGSLGLSKTFLGEIVPILEKSQNVELRAYAQEIGGIKRRASMLGEELEFECILIDGTKFNLKDLRGKVVLINFWNTHCGPCLREFPNMQAQYEKYKEQGYEMLAYSCGDPLEDLENFFAKHPSYTWLNGSLLMSEEQGIKNYADYYGINANPTTFLVDREGKVIFMMVGSDDEQFNRELEKAFAE